MNKKAFLSLAAALCVAVSATAISACDKHKHTYADELTDCGAAGHWYAATCGHEVDGKDFEEHNYGNWNIVTDATEENAGLRTRTCDDCGYVDEAVIEKLEHKHTYADELTDCGAAGHWYAATCGHEVDGKDFEEHNWGEWEIIKEEGIGETHTGLKKHTCETCGYVEEVIIPGHIHTIPDKWYYDSSSHWHKTDCGDAHEGWSFDVDKEQHDMKVEETQATTTAGGHYKKYCTVCGYVFTEYDTPQLGAGSSASPFTAVDGKNEGETDETSQIIRLGSGTSKSIVQCWTYTATAAGTVLLSVDETSDVYLYTSSVSIDDAKTDRDYLEWLDDMPEYSSFEYEVGAGDVIYMIARCHDSSMGAYNFNITFTAA